MSIRYTIMRKMLVVDNHTSVAEANLWNIHAFAIHQMMMWETIYKKSTKTEYIAKLVVASFIAKPNHRILFYKSVMENVFLYPEVKELFSEWFIKMQRTYWGFSRLALIWKWRKPRIQIYTDLYMNELEISHKHTYPMMQLGNVYLFALSNLVNLITTAICHANHFCNEPLPIKNPYNNVTISKADLYNIYFRVRDIYIKTPFFFRRFFECNFNVYLFKLECESELREHAIRDYVKSADYKDIYADIEMMIRKYDPNKYMRISYGVDKKTIVDAFRPFLSTYYLSLYSFNRTQQSNCEMKLSRELCKFIYMNYMFGKKTGKKIPSSENPFVPSEKTEYHLKLIHPSRPPLSVEYFMKSHVFDDHVFDRYIIHGDTNVAYIEPVVPMLRTSVLFGHTEVSSNEVVNGVASVPQPGEDPESEPDTIFGESDSEDGDAPVIMEEELSEVSAYESGQEEEEEDYDW